MCEKYVCMYVYNLTLEFISVQSEIFLPLLK